MEEKYKYGDLRGGSDGIPRGSGAYPDWWPEREIVEFATWSGESGGLGGTGDWRPGLMRELRVFMSFVAWCEAGIVPTARQRASCIQKLDALTAALRESQGCDEERYEQGEVRVGASFTGGGRDVTLRPREIEALRWRYKGLLPKEIAREMGITLLTARSYIRDAASKLSVSGWEAAVRRAIELGIL